MARKPNYQQERKERERAKSAKSAEKSAAKALQRERGRAESPSGGEAPEAESDD